MPGRYLGKAFLHHPVELDAGDRPRGIGQGEMPPLFVVGPEGNTSELVNYRVRGHHMIVDRLFAAAELRFGSGREQKRVRIVRTDGRPTS